MNNATRGPLTVKQEGQELALDFSRSVVELVLAEKATKDAELLEENLRIKVEKLADKFANHVSSNRPEVFYKTENADLVVVRMKYPKPSTGRAYDVKLVKIEAKE